MPLYFSFLPFAFVAHLSTGLEEAVRTEQLQALMLEKTRKRFLVLTERELSGLLDQIQKDFIEGKIPTLSYLFMKNFIEERIGKVRLK